MSNKKTDSISRRLAKINQLRGPRKYPPPFDLAPSELTDSAIGKAYDRAVDKAFRHFELDRRRLDDWINLAQELSWACFGERPIGAPRKRGDPWTLLCLAEALGVPALKEKYYPHLEEESLKKNLREARKAVRKELLNDPEFEREVLARARSHRRSVDRVRK